MTTDHNQINLLGRLKTKKILENICSKTMCSLFMSRYKIKVGKTIEENIGIQVINKPQFIGRLGQVDTQFYPMKLFTWLIDEKPDNKIIQHRYLVPELCTVGRY